MELGERAIIFGVVLVCLSGLGCSFISSNLTSDSLDLPPEPPVA